MPHVRLGQAADLVVVAPATADLLARAAHGLADDLLTERPAHRPLPGAVRAGDAHRDVGARRPRRPTSRRCARRGVQSCSSRPSAGSPAPTPARAGCPSRREIFARPRAACSTAAPARRTSPAGASSSPPAAPASTSTRCASSATARAASRATPSRAPPPTRGAEVVLVSGERRAARPGRRPGRAGDERRASCATRCSTRPPSADAVVMAAAVADYRPVERAGRPRQEDRRRR